jgi:hypothetical protein
MLAVALVLSLAAQPSMQALQVPMQTGVVRVLGFSEDGTRAAVEERVLGPAGEAILQYVIYSGRGRELVVVASSSSLVLRGPGMGQYVERVERDDCREGARRLEDALADFRTLRVHASGCARLAPARSLVEPRRTTPSPLIPGDKELSALQEDLGFVGDYFVNDDGPLVLIVGPDVNAIYGGTVVVHTALRSDPRIHKRWADPPRIVR